MNTDLSNLLGKAAQADCLRIFLDYDGTLAEFAPTPDTILPDRTLIDLMRRLVQSRGVMPAIISGRRLAHIQKLLPVPGLLLAGTYGIEMQLPDGSLVNTLDFDQVRPLITPVLTLWKKLIGESESIYIEDKGWAAALHNKKDGLTETGLTLAHIAKRTREIMPTSGFRLAGNDLFLEISPEKANKANTVLSILKDMTPSHAMILAFGDDEKDEEAFSAVVQKGGVVVRISDTPVKTIAQHIIPDPEGLRFWLKQFLKSRG